MFPIAAVQHRSQVDPVGCDTLLSGQIREFVFDTVQIPSGCIQICSGAQCNPSLPPPPPSGLHVRVLAEDNLQH